MLTNCDKLGKTRQYRLDHLAQIPLMTIELLSPAGTLTHLRYAFAYGADAVYAGQPRYSLRVRNNSFRDVAALEEGIGEARRLGKQFYLTSNIAPHNDKVRSYLRDLAPIIELGPDALIMSDPGLIMLVREQWPDQEIHLSVQANAVNWATVEFWRRQGIRRVILSRELSIEEVGEVRARVPDMEIEVFVHGALCMAYSGRCLLSGYMNHRDANQGACTNACRWDYKSVDHTTDTSGDMVPVRKPIAVTNENPVQQFDPFSVKELLLEDPKQAGEFVPVYEDEHGTYIMNSRDLRAVEHVQRLVQIGVDCLKIEGRTKSHYYTARTTQVYRRAIDDAVAGRPFDPALLGELESLANRGYTDGFFERHQSEELQQYRFGASQVQRSQFVAEVGDYDRDSGMAELQVKNKFRVGDEMELITPQGNHRFRLERMFDQQGRPLDEAPGGGWVVHAPLPVQAGNLGLVARYL